MQGKQINMAHLILPIFMFLIIPLATGQDGGQDSPQLYKICRADSKNYTEKDTFSTYLKSLLDGIYAKAPDNHGFWKAQVGEAYGVGLCRGDVSPDYCNFCLYDARCKITQRCNKKSAIVWYDYCSLKYADYDFFGQIDTKNRVGLYNVDNATDAIGFNKTARKLLGELSIKATRDKNLFAFGTKFEKAENATIYGMAQCSMDLSMKNCTVCLARAVDGLPGFTTETSPIGGRKLTGSCNVRYEIYPFLNVDNHPPTKDTLIVTTEIYN